MDLSSSFPRLPRRQLLSRHSGSTFFLSIRPSMSVRTRVDPQERQRYEPEIQRRERHGRRREREEKRETSRKKKRRRSQERLCTHVIFFSPSSIIPSFPNSSDKIFHLSHPQTTSCCFFPVFPKNQASDHQPRDPDRAEERARTQDIPHTR
jgi:hypothetical protein